MSERGQGVSEPAERQPARARRRLLTRWAQAVGLAHLAPGLRLLYLAVITAALLASVLGLLRRSLIEPGPAGYGGLAAAVAVVALAQMARVRVRIRIAYISLGWGEAAVIVALYLTPAGWVPLAMLAGVTLAMAGLAVAGERRTPAAILYNAANLAVAGGVAAALAMLVYHPLHAAVSLRLVIALIVGGTAYTVVGMLLMAASVTLRTGARYFEVLWQALTGKLFMIVGNIGIGLLVVAMLDASLLWLVMLPPVLWLFRQTYVYRLRADEERRAWRVFAEVTRSLNRLDEGGVAAAGLTGATALFAARFIELRVLRPNGTMWSYQGGEGLPCTAGPACAPPGADEPATVRQLQVGGLDVGELRLRYDRPIELTTREQMQLSAFGDALAAALHDAASHRELLALSVRSTHETQHDPLTGIANRAALLTNGNVALRALDPDAEVALLLLDVDHFKEVNDTLGHAAGDELLKITAARIGEGCRDGELAARLGGDEFGLLMTLVPTNVAIADMDSAHGEAAISGTAVDAAALDYALARARELAALVAAPTEVAGVQLAVEASIGVVAAPAGSCDMTELLRRADIAMYQAKRGAGAVAWYDAAGDVGSTDRLALLAELHEALDATDQLVLAVQPVVDLDAGRPTGAEALIRWRHPRRGELGPGEFIDVIENSDLVGPFTHYVLDRALAIAAEWAGRGVEVPISVNLSPRSLLDRRLATEIGELLACHRVPPARLILEITETVVIPEQAIVSEVLGGLRKLGVQLAVDDFGTGYSSLTFLTRVQVDELKIDRTFVARMIESPEALAIVRTTIELGRELGLRVVAEGVETAAQRSALAELGCACAQGYHFFTPVPAEKIVDTLCGIAERATGKVIPLRAEDAS